MPIKGIKIMKTRNGNQFIYKRKNTPKVDVDIPHAEFMMIIPFDLNYSVQLSDSKV
jgi:hypothetical protein